MDPEYKEKCEKELNAVAAAFDTLVENSKVGTVRWRRIGPKPESKPKEGTDCMILGYVPERPQKPVGFWDPKFCYYTVGEGEHAKFVDDRGRPFTSHVGFVHAPRQECCSGPRYGASIAKILADIHRKDPEGLVFMKPGIGRVLKSPSMEWQYLNLFKRLYHSRTQWQFTAEEKAGALIWLMEQTYPRLERLA